MRGRADIVWTGYVYDRSGFAVETRDVLVALDRAGVSVHADPRVVGWGTAIGDGTAERIERLTALEAPDRFVHVLQGTPGNFYRHPRALRTVARVMFEAESVPPQWRTELAGMDELWVPSAFNVESFVRGGIDRGRIHVVPEGIDERRFDPLPPPLRLPASGFVFLSVFGWGRRKGWDVLVQAFLEEFHPDEPVTLLVKTSPSWGLRLSDHKAELEAHIRRELGIALPRNVVIADFDVPDDRMGSLYGAASAFVLPSRGEGWCRPYMEAMASGLPTIGTRWSGNTAYMNDENAYLVDYEIVDIPPDAWRELSLFEGMRWAEPSRAHLRETMRRVYEERGEAEARGRRARADVLGGYTHAHTARHIVERLEATGIRVVSRRPAQRPARVRTTLEGPIFTTFGMAHVNRDLARSLLGTERVELSLRTDAPGQLEREPSLASLVRLAAGAPPRPPEVWIRHDWPPAFDAPPAGRLVVVQPWEWRALPAHWIEPLRTAVDEVWVPSSHVRDGFVSSGIDGDKVVVVPNGVDPLRFNRRSAPLQLPTRKRFKFLFVGGTLWRKGADLLLKAYLEAFDRNDDVCLVVKDLGASSFYFGQTLQNAFRSAHHARTGPEVVYLADDFPPSTMPSLYAACDCLVHPYRAEGFALPVAEAMACGLPVIVPAHGACLDYVDESTAYLVPARERLGERAEVGGIPTVALPRWGEPDVAALVETMRHVAAHPAEAHAVGTRASAHVFRTLTWRQAADVAADRIERLARRKPVRPVPRPRLSVCMIVRDEERTLPRALASVHGLYDDLCVVDTGSRDGTRDVAHRHGARVVDVEWADDFAAARNVSLEQARGDWAFVLDADQELDRGSRSELRRVIETRAFRGFLLRQLSYSGDGDDAVEHLDLRLFPLDAALRYDGAVHEQVRCSDPYRTFETVVADVLVHHHGTRHYDLGKAARDRRVLERAVARTPTDAFAWTNLGTACAVLEDAAAAEHAFLNAVALVARTRTPPSYLATAYVGLARAQLALRRPAAAVASAAAALDVHPGFADGLLALGEAELACGRPQAALSTFVRAAHRRTGVAAAPTDRAGWKAELGAAEALARLGRLDEAAAAVERAALASPGNERVSAARARLAEHRATREAVRPFSS